MVLLVAAVAIAIVFWIGLSIERGKNDRDARGQRKQRTRWWRR